MLHQQVIWTLLKGNLDTSINKLSFFPYLMHNSKILSSKILITLKWFVSQSFTFEVKNYNQPLIIRFFGHMP